MQKAIGNMKIILNSLVVMMSVSLIYGADNEIFIDQSGATSNLGYRTGRW